MKNYIQIGANVGNDNFQSMVSGISEKIRIILVEPNIELLETLKSNYNNISNFHDVVICPCAISLVNEKLPIYSCGISVLSSLINRKSFPLDSVINIDAITFDKLCEEYSITEIEYLEIDTEGLDYEIVNSINTSKIDIKTIVFEKWHYENDDINENYRTGVNFLDETIKPKFQNYSWESVFYFDGMENYKLTKIN